MDRCVSGKGKRPASSIASTHHGNAEEETISLEDSEIHTMPTNSQGSSAPKKKRKMKKCFEVWLHFEEAGEDENGEEVASSNYCRKLVGRDSRKEGTNSLWSYFKNWPKLEHHGQQKIDMYQQQFTYDGTTATKNQLGDLRINKLDTTKIRRSLAELVNMDEQPFSIVQKARFINYSKTLEPRFKMISRRKAGRDCMGVYLSEKSLLMNIVKELSPRVCLTTDTWTSVQNMVYMCITSHFIDHDFKLHKRIIRFKRVIDHSGLSLSYVLEGILSDWGIDKVLTITVDNASNNSTLLNQLRGRQIEKFGHVENCVLDGHRDIHMRCDAHVLNLIVKEGLVDLEGGKITYKYC